MPSDTNNSSALLKHGDAEHPMLDINFILGMPVRPRGPAYTAVMVARTMQGPGAQCRVFGQPDMWPGDAGVPIISRRPLPGEAYFARIPHAFSSAALTRTAVRQLMTWVRRNAGRSQCVYTWGETSLRMARELHAHGIPIVREKFNCAKAVTRDILAAAYAEIGERQPKPITDRQVAKEKEEMELADAVFCPSPMVRRSLLQIGVPESKLISASYGWEPHRFAGTDHALPPTDIPTFLFAGFACVRKGAHILLQAWQQAGSPGRLIFVGDIEPVIRRKYADILNSSSVTCIPFTSNIGAVFRSADWFAFPTLEEGSPLVTYEASGCGLPAIVSEMGAGGVIRDGQDGEIIRSHSVEAWADALVRLSRAPDLQRHYAENTRRHADTFVWDAVGKRRREALLAHMAQARQKCSG